MSNKVESEHGAEILKQTQAMAEMVKGMMPKVSTNQNGYEIRTKVLEMAKDHIWTDYHSKFAGWSADANIEFPNVPSTEEVLEAAGKFIEFVNGNKPSK
jgi:hypothetical protein